MNENKLFQQSQKTYDAPLFAENSSVKPHKPGFSLTNYFLLI